MYNTKIYVIIVLHFTHKYITCGCYRLLEWNILVYFDFCTHTYKTFIYSDIQIFKTHS